MIPMIFAFAFEFAFVVLFCFADDVDDKLVGDEVWIPR